MNMAYSSAHCNGLPQHVLLLLLHIMNSRLLLIMLMLILCTCGLGCSCFEAASTTLLSSVVCLEAS